MVRYELGKWNLDELVKNPTRLTIDKKLAEIEKKTKKFTSVKKNLSPNISSTKFLKLLRDIEQISEKSGMIGGYSSLRYSENTQSDEATSLLTRISKFSSEIENRYCFLICGGKNKLMKKMLTD